MVRSRRYRAPGGFLRRFRKLAKSLVIVLLMIATGAVGALGIEPLLPGGWQDWINSHQDAIAPKEAPVPAAPTSTPTILLAQEPRQSFSSLGGPSFHITDLEQLIHLLVNEGRARPLEFDSSLAAIARKHSEDQATYGYFAHENQSGQSPTDRAVQAAYDCLKEFGAYRREGIAENIFQTVLYSSYTYSRGMRIDKQYLTLEELAKQVVSGWMGSPGHRRNILDASFTHEGIGVAINEVESVYVTQNFC